MKRNNKEMKRNNKKMKRDNKEMKRDNKERMGKGRMEGWRERPRKEGLIVKKGGGRGVGRRVFYCLWAINKDY